MSLNSYFIDKTVAIIGNANSLFLNKEKYGGLIDSFDTVCRFNLGAKIKQEEAQGSKTTIVFNNGLRSTFPDFKTIAVLASNVSFETRNVCAYTLPEKSNEEIRNHISCERPSCGMLAMYYISQLKTKGVALFGFDWKESKTFYHKENTKGPHNWNAERKYTTEVLLQKENWKLI